LLVGRQRPATRSSAGGSRDRPAAGCGAFRNARGARGVAQSLSGGQGQGILRFSSAIVRHCRPLRANSKRRLACSAYQAAAGSCLAGRQHPIEGHARQIGHRFDKRLSTRR
jgi:hypothetical protein